MKTLIACLLLLVAAPCFAAAPSAFAVKFSNGVSVTAADVGGGEYRWSLGGGVMVVKLGPTSITSGSQIRVSWSGGVSEMTGAVAGDGSAVVTMTILDTRSKAFDMVTLTPIP